MKPRMLLALAAAVMASVLPARAASAQAQPDTAELVRAVAAVLADSVIPRLNGGCDPVYLREPETAFDSAVAALLRDVPGVRASARQPPYSESVGTRGFTMRGDTAAVMVEWDTSSPGGGEFLGYIETNLHLFVRDERGWRQVRREFVRGADYGGVRG